MADFSIAEQVFRSYLTAKPVDSPDTYGTVSDEFTIPSGSGIYEAVLSYIPPHRSTEFTGFTVTEGATPYTETLGDPSSSTEFRVMEGYAIVRFQKSGTARDVTVAYTGLGTNITAGKLNNALKFLQDSRFSSDMHVVGGTFAHSAGTVSVLGFTLFVPWLSEFYTNANNQITMAEVDSEFTASDQIGGFLLGGTLGGAATLTWAWTTAGNYYDDMADKVFIPLVYRPGTGPTIYLLRPTVRAYTSGTTSLTQPVPNSLSLSSLTVTGQTMFQGDVLFMSEGADDRAVFDMSAGQFYPTAIGVSLGTTTNRWDAYLYDVSIAGDLSVSGEVLSDVVMGASADIALSTTSKLKIGTRSAVTLNGSANGHQFGWDASCIDIRANDAYLLLASAYSFRFAAADAYRYFAPYNNVKPVRLGSYFRPFDSLILERESGAIEWAVYNAGSATTARIKAADSGSTVEVRGNLHALLGTGHFQLKDAADSSAVRLTVQNTGETTINPKSTSTGAALTLDVDHASAPFLAFEGATSAEETDATPINTGNGDGDLSGPRLSVSANGWAFQAMVKVLVNGTAMWIPAYTVDEI